MRYRESLANKMTVFLWCIRAQVSEATREVMLHVAPDAPADASIREIEWLQGYTVHIGRMR